MRAVLWVVFIVGVCSICNDTRGAQFLVFPGMLAGVILVSGALTHTYDGKRR